MKIFYVNALLLLALSAELGAQTFQYPTTNSQSIQSESSREVAALKGQMTEGYATYYADYIDNMQTALGEVYRRDQMTASHRSYPLGTLVRVTREDTRQSVDVRINDRGAYCDDCVIDLSWIAAQSLDLVRSGRTRVKVQVIGYADVNPVPPVDRDYALAPASMPAGRREPMGNPADYYAATATQAGANPTTPVNFPGSMQARGAYEEAEEAPEWAPKSASPRPAAQQPSGTGFQWDNEPRPRVGNSSPAPRAAASYGVQTGLFSNIANAQRQLEQLNMQGYSNVLIKPDSNGMFRVLLAPFTTEAEARQFLLEVLGPRQIEGVVSPL
jgi:rare lipoprotein A